MTPSCGDAVERYLFQRSKVVVHCSWEHAGNVWVSVSKLTLNCEFILFGRKWIASESRMLCQCGSSLPFAKACCFKWARQQLLWSFLRTPVASQNIWYPSACKIKNMRLLSKCAYTCCNYYSPSSLHLWFGVHSTPPPLLEEQSDTTGQPGLKHSTLQGCHPYIDKQYVYKKYQCVCFSCSSLLNLPKKLPFFLFYANLRR